LFEQRSCEFGRFSCLSANFSSEAGAVLIFFCFVFLYQDKKMKKNDEFTKSRGFIYK